MASDEENDLATLGAGISLAIQVGRSVVSAWVEAVPVALKEALVLVSQCCNAPDAGRDNATGRKGAAQLLVDDLLMPVLLKKIKNQNVYKNCHQQQPPDSDVLNTVAEWTHICLQTIFMEIHDKNLSLKERASLANHQFQVQMFLSALCLPKSEDLVFVDNQIPAWLGRSQTFVVVSLSDLDFLHLCFTHYLQLSQDELVPVTKKVYNIIKNLSPPGSEEVQGENSHTPFVLHLKFGCEENSASCDDQNEAQRKLSEFHWLIRCANFHVTKALALRNSQITGAEGDEETYSSNDRMASVVQTLEALNEELKKKSYVLKQTLNHEKVLKSTGEFYRRYIKELSLSTQLVEDEYTAKMAMKGKQLADICSEENGMRDGLTKAFLSPNHNKKKPAPKNRKENIILATMLSSNPLSDLLRTTFSSLYTD